MVQHDGHLETFSFLIFSPSIFACSNYTENLNDLFLIYGDDGQRKSEKFRQVLCRKMMEKIEKRERGEKKRKVEESKEKRHLVSHSSFGFLSQLVPFFVDFLVILIGQNLGHLEPWTLRTLVT